MTTSRYDLSILIPSRNEEYTRLTVEDILKNKRGKTEVIVGMDGEWCEPGIDDHPDVRIFYSPKALGQRAMTNQLARLSKAKYVMKLDAHCAFGEGFDTFLMEDMNDDWTVVPTMYNLHAFDRVCTQCGDRRYQGPLNDKHGFPEQCSECGSGPIIKEMVWEPKKSPKTTSMRFDTNLKFQYWGGYKHRQQGDVVDTMSILGACWMLTRAKYWELNICDEEHGSWGQQGTEVACKTWLSGGRLACNTKTWFAHMFRTQGRDFGFPYPQDGNQVDHAREYSNWLWKGNNWDQAIHTLEWLIDRFSPVPDWETQKGIVYYTDNRLKVKIAKLCQGQLKKIGLPITSASLKPMNFGKNVYLQEKRGYLTMFKQQLSALEACEADIVFFCEHDVLYHPSHFSFTPEKEDVFYYNTNVWKVRAEDGHALWVDSCRQASGICVYRETAVKHYRERVALIENEGITSRIMGFEPGTHNRINWQYEVAAETWSSDFPNIDIRHEGNLTPNRWDKKQFRDQRNTKGWTETTADLIPGWSDLSTVLEAVK